MIIGGFWEKYHGGFIRPNQVPRFVPSPDDPHDPAILAELARETERILDLQVKAFERAEDKSDRLISLSLAVLGGGLSLATLALALALALGGRGSWREAVGLGPMSLGAAFNLGSLVLFLRASPGLLEHHDVRLGPAPSALARRALDKTWELADHYLNFIDAMADCHVENLANLARAVTARQRGLRLLLCAIGAYALAVLFIAGTPKVV